MTIPTLHVPQKDSPQSALAAGINDTETVLTLDDSSIFEADAITRLTLGIDQSATEVVTISSYDGSNKITVVRGTPAYSWPLGTLVARVLNADDITEIHQYLEDLHTTLSGGSTVTNGDSHDHSGGDGAAIPEGGIGTGAVTADKIGTGAVTADKIGTGAVTTAKIGADAIDGTKIADDVINSEHIYPGAIDTEHIGDSQITSLKLATSSVIEGKIATGAVTKNKIGTGAVSELKLSFDLPKPAEGRLTLESGVPVSSTDQADKTTLYYTPYVGNTIALYNGTSWDLVTFAELSLDISGFTASKPYDIFVYNNSGTATLEGLVWTDGSTRATALAYQDGVLSLTGSLTRRYVGTIYMAADAKCDDSIATRYVWNMYNRVGRQMNTTGLAYNTDQTAAGKLYYVHGLEQVVYAGLGGRCTATTGSYCGLYLLFDTASWGSASATAGIWSQTAIQLHCNCAYGKQVAEGLRYVALGLNVQTTAGSLSEGYTWAVVEG